MTEEWRALTEWPGYEVSSEGRVRSWRRYSKGKVLKATPAANGYRRVSLRREGKTTYRNVHDLVAEAFLGPRPTGLQVRHLDTNKLNLHPENLAYGTALENADDGVRNGRVRRGESSGTSKLREVDVLEIRARLADGDAQGDIAKNYGVAQMTISNIQTGKTWRHIE